MLAQIFGAITGVTALIDAGKAIFETVAGKPSAATTAPDLQAEVEALPADQRDRWAAAMNVKIEAYKAESARIQNEQGEVTADVLRTLDPKAAATVAILRMTTRPRVVLMMAHVILLPVYVTILDVALMILNGGYRSFSGNREFAPFDLFAEKLFGEGSIYVVMYQWSAPTAAVVVVSYITAKTVEAVKNGASAGDGIAGAIGKAVAAVGSLRQAVRR
jgi:hypothetical protein